MPVRSGTGDRRRRLRHDDGRRCCSRRPSCPPRGILRDHDARLRRGARPWYVGGPDLQVEVLQARCVARSCVRSDHAGARRPGSWCRPCRRAACCQRGSRRPPDATARIADQDAEPHLAAAARRRLLGGQDRRGRRAADHLRGLAQAGSSGVACTSWPRLHALEVRAELLGRLVAVRRVLRQRAHHDRVQPRRHVGVQLRGRHRRLVHLLVGHGDRRVADERRPPGEHLVQHAAERVDVRAPVDRLALRLLGRQVRRPCRAPRRSARRLRPASIRAMPKSMTFTSPSRVSMMLPA